jgi:hypothetical protein
MRDKIDDKVGSGKNHNYQLENFKEFMFNLIRYYVDPRTNKIIEHDLDRKNYSIST